MQVGILSDTHGYFHPALPEYLSPCDIILHAGDVGRLSVLTELQKIAPVRAVYGNVDGQDIRKIAPEHEHLLLAGMKVWMTHIGGHPGRWDRRIRDLIRLEPPDILICGHSHILRMERVAELGNMLYINPGAAGREGFHRVKTCVRLHLDQGKATQAEVIHLEDGGMGGPSARKN